MGNNMLMGINIPIKPTDFLKKPLAGGWDVIVLFGMLNVKKIVTW